MPTTVVDLFDDSTTFPDISKRLLGSAEAAHPENLIRLAPQRHMVDWLTG